MVIAKSSIVFDIKPWDDETDLGELEKKVRTVKMDGLLWGACKYYILSCSLFAQNCFCSLFAQNCFCSLFASIIVLFFRLVCSKYLEQFYKNRGSASLATYHEMIELFIFVKIVLNNECLVYISKLLNFHPWSWEKLMPWEGIVGLDKNKRPKKMYTSEAK